MRVMIRAFGIALVYLACCYASEPSKESAEVQDRVYFMKKCSGSGCPYTASWLAHTNLYKKIPWWLDSTKMEAASFNIFDRAKLKFQLSDPEAYFVHHMSMYEHQIHKKYGFAEAKNKTLILSKAAFKGECENLQISKTKEYVALIPFYGGLPPGVTKDLTVKSIGQGNSLVDSFTKGLQTMATLCSCLKYYGHVIIGVARDEDRILLNDMLQQKLSAEVRHHTNVVQFQMPKPAHLPFHLLAWGQQYVRVHNCYQFYTDKRQLTETAASAGNNSTSPGSANGGGGSNNSSGSSTGAPTAASFRGGATAAQLAYFKPDNYPAMDTTRIPKSDLFEICAPGAIVASYQGPVNVVYLKKFDVGRHRIHRHVAPHVGNATHSGSNNASAADTIHHPYPAIKFVYYTESDQVVYYDSFETLRALSTASNDSTFFVGKRKEKGRESDPEDYMGTLNNWRECGVPGFSLTWPKDTMVRID